MMSLLFPDLLPALPPSSTLNIQPDKLCPLYNHKYTQNCAKANHSDPDIWCGRRMGFDIGLKTVAVHWLETYLKFQLLVCRLAETPECWSLEFQLDATFADILGHICRQFMVYLQTILSYKKTQSDMEFSWNSLFQHSGVSACYWKRPHMKF